MLTSNDPVPVSDSSPPRTPLRLRMAAVPGLGELDGGWWPQSRDLEVEVADLVDHFPAGLGGVARVLYSPPDWDSAPRRIPVARGVVKAGFFPRDDTHLILLTTLDRTVLRLLVVPPHLPQDQGEEALLAAATVGAYSPKRLLSTVTNSPDVDPFDFWEDDGGGRWDPDGGAPRIEAGD